MHRGRGAISRGIYLAHRGNVPNRHRPGALDQITPAAQQALSRCDVLIGYELYLSLIRPLLDSWKNPQQVTEGTPITKERYRAERAISLAQKGLTVGVISSGDCGIYAMAGLVLECLAQQNWDGHTPSVTTYPGITALQAAAARAGAPLMHDFCAISLSDRKSTRLNSSH